MTARRALSALSQLLNDAGFITAAGAPVQSVAGKAGVVLLVQGDIAGLTDALDAKQPLSAVLTATTASFLTAHETKLGHISVTGAVDLDQMETDIAALANGMVYKGDWDASAGSFPGAGAAQIGWFYYVTVAGTVNGVEFAVGDNIVATVDNASAAVYAANWSKHDQTDAVQAVVGLTGSISKAGLLAALNVEDGADVTDTANVTAAGALMDSECTNLAAVKALNQGVATGDTPTHVSLKLSARTSGRVAIIGTDGEILDDDGLTFNSAFNILTVGSTTNITANGVQFAGGWSSIRGSSAPTNCFVFGGANVDFGFAATRVDVNKPVTGIADATPTNVLTFTVPNGPQSGSFEVTLVGTLGAGGAVGENESTQTAKYRVDIARTAGKNADAKISAVYPQAAAAAVAGADTIATTGALSAISGAVGATNTFTVTATLTKSGGSSSSHKLLVYVQHLNANSSGITVL